MHNAEHFVTAAVRSVLDPSFPEVEVLVIDDGSTDRSVAEATAIDDPRVTVIQIPPSGGPSRPRNVGIERARAPYVAFLDADDLMKPNKLSATVAALDRRLDAGFAFADFERIGADGTVIEQSVLTRYPVFRNLATVPIEHGWYLIPQAELARGLLYENFIGTCGVVVRRELLTEIGHFDDSLVCSEDRDLWFRLGHRCAALYWDHIGFSYRMNPASLSHGPAMRNAGNRTIVLLRERARWSDRAARRQLNRLIAENMAAIGYEQRLRRRRLGSMAMFAQAFATSPELRWLRGLLGSIVS